MKVFLFLISFSLFGGINKSVSLDNGFTVDNWDLQKIDINYTKNKMVIYVAAYKDKAARLAGKDAVIRKVFEVDIPNKLQDKSAVFEKLKQLPEFSGASDD